MAKASEPQGNGGARPHNAETAGAEVSFRPHINLIFCGLSRLARRKIYKPSHKSWTAGELT